MDEIQDEYNRTGGSEKWGNPIKEWENALWGKQQVFENGMFFATNTTGGLHVAGVSNGPVLNKYLSNEGPSQYGFPDLEYIIDAYGYSNVQKVLFIHPVDNVINDLTYAPDSGLEPQWISGKDFPQHHYLGWYDEMGMPVSAAIATTIGQIYMEFEHGTLVNILNEARIEFVGPRKVQLQSLLTYESEGPFQGENDLMFVFRIQKNGGTIFQQVYGPYSNSNFLNLADVIEPCGRVGPVIALRPTDTIEYDVLVQDYDGSGFGSTAPDHIGFRSSGLLTMSTAWGVRSHTSNHNLGPEFDKLRSFRFWTSPWGCGNTCNGVLTPCQE